jgi:hypothetical protein
MVVKHKRHPIISKMRKALDRIEDEIADKVVHELKEHKMCEGKEHRHHPKGCKCANHRKAHKKR